MARGYVLQGGDGVISPVTANVAPAQVAKVMAAARDAKDVTAAAAAVAPLLTSTATSFARPNPV